MIPKLNEKHVVVCGIKTDNGLKELSSTIHSRDFVRAKNYHAFIDWCERWVYKHNLFNRYADVRLLTKDEISELTFNSYIVI